jgi:prevent-host-death family protein
MPKRYRGEKHRGGMRSDSWTLREASSRFRELVRRAKTDGPQVVTVRGREEVIVVAAREFRRLKRERTGKALVKIMRNCPSDLDIERPGERLPVRDGGI